MIAILKSIPAQVTVTEVVRTKELITLQRLKNENNESVIQFETAIAQDLLNVFYFLKILQFIQQQCQKTQ